MTSWEQATVCFWPATFTVLDDNSLQRAHTAEAMTRRHSIFFAARRTCRHGHPPTTSMQPILDACGPFWSRSGPWHAPRPGMRERVHCQVNHQLIVKFQCGNESKENIVQPQKIIIIHTHTYNLSRCFCRIKNYQSSTACICVCIMVLQPFSTWKWVTGR